MNNPRVGDEDSSGPQFPIVFPLMQFKVTLHTHIIQLDSSLSTHDFKGYKYKTSKSERWESPLLPCTYLLKSWEIL